MWGAEGSRAAGWGHLQAGSMQCAGVYPHEPWDLTEFCGPLTQESSYGGSFLQALLKALSSEELVSRKEGKDQAALYFTEEDLGTAEWRLQGWQWCFCDIKMDLGLQSLPKVLQKPSDRSEKQALRGPSEALCCPGSSFPVEARIYNSMWWSRKKWKASGLPGRFTYMANQSPVSKASRNHSFKSWPITFPCCRAALSRGRAQCRNQLGIHVVGCILLVCLVTIFKPKSESLFLSKGLTPGHPCCFWAQRA